MMKFWRSLMRFFRDFEHVHWAAPAATEQPSVERIVEQQQREITQWRTDHPVFTDPVVAPYWPPKEVS